jgi:membrane-associated phospholipid phosphatase
MEAWLKDLIPWGYRILLEIQQWRTPALDSFFLGVTGMGSAPFYIMLLPLLYWCVNKQVGLGLTFVYLSSTYVNNWLKSFFAIPRPGDPAVTPILEQAGITGRVEPLAATYDPSWPSNHAQGATVTWGYLASRLSRGWTWIVAAVLIALISFSRLYLAVHFPQDVISGILIGAVYLGLWIAIEPGARIVISRWSFAIRVAAVLLIPALALALFSDLDSARLNGVIAGMGVGHLVQERWLGFDPRGLWWKRALRGAVGLVLVAGAYVGLAAVFPEVQASALDVILRAVRYGLVGLVGTLLAPWLFLALNLAEREGDSGGTQGS